MEVFKRWEFSVKSAYQLARQEENNGNSFQGSWIWKLDILPKIIHFLWLSFHSSIPVHGVRASRGINCNKLCPLCKRSEESILHLLRDCNLTREFWRKLEPPPALISTFNDNFEAWLKVNSTSRVLHKSTVHWGILFLFAIWFLWKNRNKVVFENSIPNPNLHKACIHQAREYFYCVSKTIQATKKVAIQVGGINQLMGGLNLTLMGHLVEILLRQGAVASSKNCHGHWIKGYSRSIGYTISIIAEW